MASTDLTGTAAGARHAGSMASLDSLGAVVQLETLGCEAVFATDALGLPTGPTTRMPVASDAVRAAIEQARHGRRASVLLTAHEVLGALEALAGAAAARVPLVVHVLPSHGVGPTARLEAGRHELAPALDVGAGVLVTSGSQEAVDVALAARRAAEDSETPFLHLHDPSSRAPADVWLPDLALVQRFLGRARPARPLAGVARAGAGAREERLEAVARKRAERGFAARVPFALGSALRDLGDLTGRVLGPIERFATSDAEEILVAVGSAFEPAMEAARVLRAGGKRVGAVGVRALRPFFGAEIVKVVARARAIVVLEPLDVALAPCGPVAGSLKAAFADALTWAPGFPGVGRIPPIVSVVFATVDGHIGEAQIRAALAEIASGERARRLVVFGSDWS